MAHTLPLLEISSRDLRKPFVQPIKTPETGARAVLVYCSLLWVHVAGRGGGALARRCGWWLGWIAVIARARFVSCDDLKIDCHEIGVYLSGGLLGYSHD
jgi:hypothetical protein